MTNSYLKFTCRNLIWFILFTSSLFATQVVYRTDGHEMNLFEHPDRRIIQVPSGITKQDLQGIVERIPSVDYYKQVLPNSDLYVLERDPRTDWRRIEDEIERHFTPIRWITVYHLQSDLDSESEFLLTDRIVVKFVPGTSDRDIDAFASGYGRVLTDGNATSRRCIFTLLDQTQDNPLDLTMQEGLMS